MKHVIITFDYEGSWGMPNSHPYDLATTTQGLLELLDRNHAKAVFFVTGKLVGEYPDIIGSIHNRGHEIGIHGYEHEHMHSLTDSQVATLASQLDQTSRTVKAITGYRPRGFRAPYLMGPVFYDPRVYAKLADLGFTWVSNREIRMPEELFRPGRLPFGLSLTRLPLMRSLILLALNFNLLLTERPAGPSLTATVRWLLQNPAPFARPEGLTEYPLSSPLDCDLLGMPDPSANSSERSLHFARATIQACATEAGDTLTINSHDWIIGTANRPAVLEGTLRHLATTGSVNYLRPGLDQEGE